MASSAGKRKSGAEKTRITKKLQPKDPETLKKEILQELRIINRFSQRQPCRRDMNISRPIEEKEIVRERSKKEDTHIDRILRKEIVEELKTIKNKAWDGSNIYSEKVASLTVCEEMCRTKHALNIDQTTLVAATRRVKQEPPELE